MNEFYKQLRSGKTKAEALQEAQKILLDKDRVSKSLTDVQKAINEFLGQSRKSEQSYTLSKDTQARLEEIKKVLESKEQLKMIAKRLSSPVYWSAFTIVGSPW